MTTYSMGPPDELCTVGTYSSYSRYVPLKSTVGIIAQRIVIGSGTRQCWD